MKRMLLVLSVAALVAVLLLLSRGNTQAKQPFTLIEGPVNTVFIERDGARLAVYGSGNPLPGCERVLLTHHRRDVCEWARALITAGAAAVAPEAERNLIETPGKFWEGFSKTRFHDYDQQTTKILTTPLPVHRWVKDGDVIDWRGLRFRVLDTPGYTRGAVSYLVEVDGQRLAFTGDLIYGDGQLFDLYSLQEEINLKDDPALKDETPKMDRIRGYHGYAARLAQLIPSLKKIAAAKPDLLIPARGPVVRNPQQAIERLISRVQAVYRNYLSTNALNWYFKEKRLTVCGERVLGKGADVQLMPYSHHEEPPAWVWAHSTSRLLISDDGHGFLLDCGYQRVIDALKKLQKDGPLKQIDGIFVTHCHDDHTDFVQAAAAEFKCPVYALEEYANVLANPDFYHLPALTTNPIKDIRRMKSGARLDWKEFQLTFHYYPGQMLHHGALLVEKARAKPIFFVGDSFSPSGIDDYCLLNRNLVHEDQGYLRCLKQLRGFAGNYWLINEHIPFVFTFSDKELDYLESRYRERINTLRELFPWDDANYGIDEQWAVFYPYSPTVAPGAKLDLEVRLTNHSPQPRTFRITPHAPAALKLEGAARSLTLQPRQSGSVRMTAQSPAEPGNYLVTADVDSSDIALRHWIEAFVLVK